MLEIVSRWRGPGLYHRSGAAVNSDTASMSRSCNTARPGGLCRLINRDWPLVTLLSAAVHFRVSPCPASHILSAP